MIGAAGLYDQWRSVRITPGLAGLVDAKSSARGYEETVEKHPDEGQELRKEVGRGRVFYLPSLRFDGPLPEFGAYFKVDNRYWKKPANTSQFLEGLAWARRGEPTVRVDGPKHLVANAVEQPSRRSTLVHLVNYDASQGPAADVKITCRNAKNPRAASVHLYGPDLNRAQQVSPETNQGAVVFHVPGVKTYVIAAVEWAS